MQAITSWQRRRSLESRALEKVTPGPVGEGVVLQGVTGPVQSGGQAQMALEPLPDAKERGPGFVLGEDLCNPRRVRRMWTVVEGQGDLGPSSRAPPHHRPEERGPWMKDAKGCRAEGCAHDGAGGDDGLRGHVAAP
jgi:hypothetical protein